jgi:hypothetical protein
MSAADRARAIAVAEVVAFMRKRKIALSDLVRFGGQDVRSSAKARCVEKAWSLMARLGVSHADLGGDQ